MSSVPIADVRTYLGVDTTDAPDALLQPMLDAAELYVSSKLDGPLLSTAVTQRVPGYGSTLMLEQTPIVSVDSVTDPTGGTLTVGNLDVDLIDGMIHWDAYSSRAFMFPFYTVNYHAGYAVLPADLAQAVKSRTAYYWATQRGPRDENADAEAERARCDSILASRRDSGFS